MVAGLWVTQSPCSLCSDHGHPVTQSPLKARHLPGVQRDKPHLTELTEGLVPRLEETKPLPGKASFSVEVTSAVP